MNKVVVCAMTCIALKLVLFIVKKRRNFFFIFYLKKRKIEKEVVVGCTELLKTIGQRIYVHQFCNRLVWMLSQ